ncbi:MAG: signal peptidase II [Acidimicrobiaceae bacterium]|nr:signal peptidase II [Acidimicrobiia bacterium]MCY4493547.1 signal peptidase II [Acidimicrobiaceae bacterium]
MRSRKWQVTGVVIATVVVLDQLSKEWAIGRLRRGRTIDVLPTLEFDLTYNSGFSFGAGAGYGPLVGALVIVLCGFIGWRIWVETLPVRAGILAAILGGALGNLTDRVVRGDDGFLSGEVVDFIDVSWYAVFNVADMFVVCGCFVLVLYELRHRADAAEPSSGEDRS